MRWVGEWLRGKRKEGREVWLAMATVLALSLLVARAVAQEEQKLDEVALRAQPERRVLVSIPDRRLALLENGRVVKVYPVAVGARVSPSPAGSFQVVNRLTDPTYYHPGVVIGPGPANPLGNRWIGLNRKGYGIHGTNEPDSIGKAASHGCIRMRKVDLEDLFERLRPGDTVEIRGQRDPETAALFGVPAAVELATAAAAPALQGGAR